MNNIVNEFKIVVENFPMNVAIKDKNRELTYMELDQESTRVASELRRNGIKKGEFVSIFLKRSVDTIVSILGILKAGGAYVALDPTHPEDRNRYIINDTKSPFLLTNSELYEETCKLNVKSKTVLIDQLDNEGEEFKIDINENDLAYVIYTSGTTGNPKGTLLRHVGVLNLSEWIQTEYNINPNDTLLQFATFSFDASVYETFVSLFNGSTLYLIDDEDRMSSEHFIQTVDRENITVITALPTIFFNQLSKYAKQNGLTSIGKVRSIGVAGELLTGEVVRNFKKQFGTETVLYNLYGPTETTVAASFYRTPDVIDETVYSVPIGKETKGTKLYVVNENGERCIPGETGELWIASKGISVGYLNNLEKTNEVFIKNPFSDDFEGMVYKSGDLVKELEDGNLEFVDRKDTQVKIRGHRIEIAEIENRLSQIKGIDDGIVVVEESDGDKLLKAFYTSNQELNGSFIINELKKNLTSYMIPSKIKQIPSIPFAPTGKVDRKKLSLIEADNVFLGTDIVNPRNEVEETILNAWKEVLNIEGIGVTDSFFEVGGHSLKIIAVLALLKKTYKHLRISDFFELKTVEKLANKAMNSIKESTLKEIVFTRCEEYPKIEVPNELKEVNHVVLTGATGFLGSHLLKQITDEFVHTTVIVRGKNARERLSKVYRTYFSVELTSRVEVLEGDITKRHFGLDEKTFSELAFKTDAIIHSAADVRHFGDREGFEKINVDGTKHVFELVNYNPEIAFHHISTVGVIEDLVGENKWHELEGSATISNNLSLNNVYTDTKLEAERFVLSKEKECKNIFIYRMGNLTGRKNDGVFQSNIDRNAFYRSIKLMILLGKAPIVNWMVDFTPVDLASEVVTKSVLTTTHSQRVYHVTHPKPIHYRDMIHLINDVGYHVELLPLAEYEEILLSLDPSSEANQLAVSQLDGDGVKDSEVIFDSRKTMEVLLFNDVPEIDYDYMQKMLSYAVKVEYLPNVKEKILV